MKSCRFNVFGSIILVECEGAGWKPFIVGPEGKRRPAAFVIPDFVLADEIEQYLADLFHENATTTNGDVRRIA